MDGKWMWHLVILHLYFYAEVLMQMKLQPRSDMQRVIHYFRERAADLAQR